MMVVSQEVGPDVSLIGPAATRLARSHSSHYNIESVEIEFRARVGPQNA